MYTYGRGLDNNSSILKASLEYFFFLSIKPSTMGKHAMNAIDIYFVISLKSNIVNLWVTNSTVVHGWMGNCEK